MNFINGLDFVSEDVRKRKYLLPISVLKTEGGVSAPSALLLKKSTQIAIIEPSITRLENKGEENASVLLDFGFEICGGVRILAANSRASAPVRVRITFGESVSEAISTVGSKFACNDHAMRDFEAYIPKLSDQELGQTGFRYVRIELLDRGSVLNLKAVLGVLTYRELEYAGSFECSDELLNRIYDTAAYTVHLNMQNMLWDGIKRDRLVWVGDTHPEYLAIRTLFGDCSMVFDNLRFARDEAVLPAWMNGLPSYSLWWLLILRDASFTENDYSLVYESREYIKGLLSLIFSRIREDGTHELERYFLDWQTNQKPEAVAGVHALMYSAIKAGGELCRVLGEESLSDECERYCLLLRANVPDPMECSSANALLVNEGLGGSLDVILRNGEYDMSTLMSYYIVKALADNGETQRAVDMLRAYYGGMLSMGATTFWEDFDMRWLENATRIDEFPKEGKLCVHADRGQHCYKGLRHSLCHGWSAGPVAFLAEYILGIRVLAAGGRTVKLCPELCGLEYAKGSYPTKYGVITVEWRNENGKPVLVNLTKPREVTVIYDGE